MFVPLESPRHDNTDIGSCRGIQEWRPPPIATPGTCLWTRVTSVVGPTPSLDPFATVPLVSFPGHIRFLVGPHWFSTSVPVFAACLCPCIVYSNIGVRLDHLSNQGSPHPNGDEACDGDCVGYAATCCFVSCLLQVRSTVVAGFSCWITQPPHRWLGEGKFVGITTSPVAVVATASLPTSAIFAASSRSLVRSNLRRTVTGTGSLKLSSLLHDPLHCTPIYRI